VTAVTRDLTTAPRLDTERLVLSAHVLGDFDDCARMWGDPVVTRYISGRPSTPEEVWARLHRYVGHWALLGFGYWAAREKATGRFLGELGFADFHRDVTPSFEGKPEAGWVIAPWAHGKGFATEAMRAALAWADALPRWKDTPTVCMISPVNVASLHVAEKCGYREIARTVYKGEASIVLERPAQRLIVR
jgi:RimJ/RimL family protein N-acetyltransferase